MKNRAQTIVAALIIATITFAFTTIEDGKKEVKVEPSSVTWKGYKVTGSHTGNIALKKSENSIYFEKGTISYNFDLEQLTEITLDDIPVKLINKKKNI